MSQVAWPPSACSIEIRPSSMKSMMLNPPPNSTSYSAASCAAGSLSGAGVAEVGSHGVTLRNAIASASLACPAAVGCADAASAVSAPAVPSAVGTSPKPTSCVAGSPSSCAIAYSPSIWYSFRLTPPPTMPQVVSAPSISPRPCCASSALIRPPIEVPTASTCDGRCGSTVDSTAARVPNWSLTAVSSAHSELFGSYEEPASA